MCKVFSTFFVMGISDFLPKDEKHYSWSFFSLCLSWDQVRFVTTQSHLVSCKSLTFLENFITYGKSCSMCLIVRDKFDKEKWPWRHERRRGDLSTELSQYTSIFVFSIDDLHIVIPETKVEGNIRLGRKVLLISII